MCSSFKIQYLVLIFIYPFSEAITAIPEKSNLIFATILYRHGDRTPHFSFLSDQWGDAKNWPEGWGQLTNLGKTQQYELGTWLRARYRHTVLGESYNENNIYIRSSDFDRTLMSAYANLAALYPPSSTERFISTLPWQPIPVHTVPRQYEDITVVKDQCAAYTHYRTHTNIHNHTINWFSENKELLDYIHTHIGFHLNSVYDVQILFDTLSIHQFHNKRLPAWTQNIFPEGEGKFRGQLQRLCEDELLSETRTPQLARLTYGRLLKEILERFQNKSEGTLMPNRSVHIYSAHDTTVSGLLNTLGLFEPRIPPYTATVLLELRRIDRSHFVQIFYRTNTTVEPEPMNIPNCGQSCPLEKMFQLYAHVLPAHDSDTECQWPPAKRSA